MSFELESPESSSPIVTRAVAAGLRGEYCDNYQFPKWQKYALLALGSFPQIIGSKVISRFEAISGLNPNLMDNFSIDTLVNARLDDYKGLRGPFPAILFGSALSGAVSYLALALGGPFLPQAFVTTLKGGSYSGDINVYLHRTLNMALRIADENPGLMTIQHFDPVHDGWMTRFVNHLRFKLLDLPQAYADFIRTHLKPGGAVVYLDCGATWQRYRIGTRSVFQVGGWGGIPAKEFLDGSERLRIYARKAGLKSTDWKLHDYPLESGPESEWGSEPGLAEALEKFCQAEGFHFVRIHMPQPNDFSRLAFNSAKLLVEKENQIPSGVLVEMFTQFDAYAAISAGLLPLWLIFNTPDSLEFLREMRGQFPAGKPIFFSPLATFSITPDLVPWSEWEFALEGLQCFNIGTRASHYPADSRALVKWAEPLRNWVKENRKPIRSNLSVGELEHLAFEIIRAQKRTGNIS